MQRRGGSGRPRKRKRASRPNARKASSIRASVADLQGQLDERTRERDEALEQWTATTEVLEVISHSTFDLQTVLASLVRSAGQLCRAENVQIFLRDGEVYRLVADNGFSPEYEQYAREHPIKPGRNTLVARTALEGRTVYIPDVFADPEYTYGGQKLGGYRTLLGVPLLRDGNCIGVVALTRSKVHPFTDNQIRLVTNFAAQAVLAIANTRLVDELRGVLFSSRRRRPTFSRSSAGRHSTCRPYSIRWSNPQPEFAKPIPVSSGVAMAIYIRSPPLSDSPRNNAISLHATEQSLIVARFSGAQSLKSAQFMFLTCWPIRNSIRVDVRISRVFSISAPD